MLRGELYRAFAPELLLERQRCKAATKRFNNAGDTSRRQQVELWRDINGDSSPLPPVLPDEEQDAALFNHEPWIEAPLTIDYGTNTRLGSKVYLNSNCTILDVCLVTIGARTLVGPNVCLYAATHPLDPQIRNGMEGPELGQEIHVGEDCWIGGNVIILPGVRIGDGAAIGAGSVVVKDVPAFHVAAGNPARVIRKITTNLDPEQRSQQNNGLHDFVRAERQIAELSDKLENRMDYQSQSS